MSVKRPGEAFFQSLLKEKYQGEERPLLVCTWRRGGHIWGQEQKQFSPLVTQLCFHVNSSRNILLYWPSTWPPCHVAANQELERVAWYILLKGMKRLHQSFNLAALQTKVWFSLSWSHLNSISTKKSPLKSLFQPTLGRISILGSILALDNRIVLLLIIHVNITFTT